MGLPVGYLPRKGDVLVLHVTVDRDVYEGAATARVLIPPNEYNGQHVELEHFTGIHRRTWEPGEHVRHRNIDNCYGEVAAQHEDRVWVKLAPGTVHNKATRGGFMTVHCNELEPVPEKAPAPLEPPPFRESKTQLLAGGEETTEGEQP